MEKKMPGRPILTIQEAEDIKRLLWEGELSQADIAYQLYISQPLVSNICLGRAYPDARWPNGLTGSMPQTRMADIARHRRMTKRGGSPIGPKRTPSMNLDEINQSALVNERLLAGEDPSTFLTPEQQKNLKEAEELLRLEKKLDKEKESND